MGVINGLIERLWRGMAAFSGDEPLMAAAAAAAALVIVADGQVEPEEVETAVADMETEPTLRAGYLPAALESEVRSSIERARTAAGRAGNLAMVSTIRNRPVEQRNNVLLVAIDVALAHRGISAVEDGVLADLAERLSVDKVALTKAAETQRLVTGAGLDLGPAT